MIEGVHEVDVVGYVDPVEGDVVEKFADAELLEVGVLLLEEAAVGGDGV
jgi:hypothetical protein